jgi:hypothetical protein
MAAVLPAKEEAELGESGSAQRTRCNGVRQADIAPFSYIFDFVETFWFPAP